MLDLITLSDEDLDSLRISVLSEIERRLIVATAREQIAALEASYEQAVKQEPTR